MSTLDQVMANWWHQAITKANVDLALFLRNTSRYIFNVNAHEINHKNVIENNILTRTTLNAEIPSAA